MFVGGIVSEDARHGAIIIEMDRSSTDPLEEIRLDPEGGDGLDNLYPQVTDTAIEEILARPEYAGIRLRSLGRRPAERHLQHRDRRGERRSWASLRRPSSHCILLFFFRSLVGVLAPTIVVQLSVLASRRLHRRARLGARPELQRHADAADRDRRRALGPHPVRVSRALRRSSAIGARPWSRTLYLVGTPVPADQRHDGRRLRVHELRADQEHRPHGRLQRLRRARRLRPLADAADGDALLRRRAPRQPRVTGAAATSTRRGAESIHARARGPSPRFVIAAPRGRSSRASPASSSSRSSGHRRASPSTRTGSNDFSDELPIKASTIRVDEVMGGITNLIQLFDGGEADAIKEPAVLARDRARPGAGRTHRIWCARPTRSSTS